MIEILHVVLKVETPGTFQRKPNFLFNSKESPDIMCLMREEKLTLDFITTTQKTSNNLIDHILLCNS